MRQWLEIFIAQAVVIIDAMAAVLVVVGTVEAFITFLNYFLERDVAEMRERQA